MIRADANALPLRDESVDLVVTSFPYYLQRAYTDGGEIMAGQIGHEDTPAEFVANLLSATQEMARVLKPGGSIFVNLGDKRSGSGGPGGDYNAGGRLEGAARIEAKEYWAKSRPASTGARARSLIATPERYITACVDAGLIYRADIIWDKGGALDHGRGRVGTTHEHWYHLTVSEQIYCNENFKPSGSVLRYRPMSRVGDHTAGFPPDMIARIIKAWSPPGGIVLDPCGGAGTTAATASALGRIGLSVDLSMDYCRLAQWRVHDPTTRAKVLRVEKPKPQIAGQASLL